MTQLLEFGYKLVIFFFDLKMTLLLYDIASGKNFPAIL